jgi:hypothetical protein
MNRSIRRARALSLACSVAMIGVIAALVPLLAYANPVRVELPPSQQTGVSVADDGRLTLVGDTQPLPAAAAGFDRFGMFSSAPRALAQPTKRLLLRFDADVPPGAAVAVDVRGSADARVWTSWQTDQPSGALVTFARALRFVQYRVRLMGLGSARPSVQQVTLETLAARPQQESAEPIAPSYRLRATRMGMVGGRTANGHIIRPRDHFVSLPSWASLSSKGGYEYTVRVTYKGRSSVAPVWDVGPWNTRDNYWDEVRERWPELRRGWPQDHAAYYDGHNGGYAEKGYVRFPTAIDVGDGVWWDDLGINGDQAEVEVTFLWLGRDPLAEPPTPTSTPTPAETATPIPTSTPYEQDGRPLGGTTTPTASAPATEQPSPTPTTPAAAPSAAPTASPTGELSATPTGEPASYPPPNSS